MNGEHLSLLDYRRHVFACYARVRDLAASDPAAAHAHWREVRDGLFATHPQSALAPARRDGFSGLATYAYNPTFAFTGRVDTDVEPEHLDVGTSGGRPMSFYRIGVVDLPVGRLDVFWLDAYAGGLFLPFRDATAGEQTYGGGRYLLDTVKGADLGSTPSAELICDFNFAYNPSCHYNDAYSCPLPPPGNRLDARVEAGEQSYPGRSQR